MTDAVEDGVSGRDFNAEMNQLVLEIINTDEDIVPPIEAWNLVTRLQETDPDLLVGWLLLHAKAFVAERIRYHFKSERSRARARAGVSAFSAAAKRFEETGDVAEMGGWLNVRYAVDDHSTQRRLAEMRREDLLFVAARYGSTARSALLEEAFHRAMANRVGTRTVGEVFSEDQLSAMYRSLRGGTHIAAS